jgi:cAMP-binding proteins - catabolite gene activator and regulatory subunit of cAMP-dependent protein kinases
VVASGCIRLVRNDPAGREAVLFVAHAGDPFAEASIFTPIYHCDAIAMTDTTVRLYPKTILLPEMERNPRFVLTYAAMLGHQLMAARTRLERLSMHSARDRLRHFLMLEVGEDGCSVEVSGTLKNLASELGLTHEVLYRTLSRMVRDGEIAREGNVIRLLDPPE